MPDLSIRILSTDKGTEFDPCSAPPGALITWDNETNQSHQIAVGSGFRTDKILAGLSSRPGYIIDIDASGTINYNCTEENHNETGTIVVTEVKPMPPEPSGDEGGE